MKQKAHAWITLRTLKRLEDYGKCPKLVEMLSGEVQERGRVVWGYKKGLAPGDEG